VLLIYSFLFRSEYVVVENGAVSIRNMDSDSSRQKEIRSHGDVDLNNGGHTTTTL